MKNVTNIPSNRVPFIDGGQPISREWYRFMLNLFNLTGAGRRDATLQPVETIVVTASPFTYINNTGGPVEVAISGGGVESMEITRGTLTCNTGSFYGLFQLAYQDSLTVNYLVAPTIKVISQ